MDVIGYLRVSTDEQARSGLGLGAQREVITAEAARRGWQVKWVIDDGYSAANLNRPGITSALAALENGGPKVLVVSKLDRLSRSLVDFAGLMERAKRKGWAVIALDLGVDMTTPSGEMLAGVMATFAQYERRIISQRTKDALAEAKRQGTRLGRPRTTPDRLVREVERMRRKGLSLNQIATALTERGEPTVRGGQRWYGSTVAGLLRSAELDRVATKA